MRSVGCPGAARNIRQHTLQAAVRRRLVDMPGEPTQPETPCPAPANTRVNTT
jgi:hypothetical protein